MTQNSDDLLSRAFARLTALRNNISHITSTFGVSEAYVKEFHLILDKLEGIGLDVAEFRIEDAMVKHGITGRTSSRGGGDHIYYTDEKYVDKPFALSKIDAILGYFEISMSEKSRTIGFRTSNGQS